MCFDSEVNCFSLHKEQLNETKIIIDFFWVTLDRTTNGNYTGQQK
jgi:hypothetical protein